MSRRPHAEKKAENRRPPWRVLQVTEAAAGGVRRHLQRLVPALRAGGLEIDVLLGTRRAEAGLDQDLTVFESLGCGVHTFGGRSLPACLLRGRLALTRLCRERRPDVIHLHAGAAGIFGRLAWPRGPVPPLCYSPHAFAFADPQPGMRARLMQVVERRLWASTDTMICVSEAEARLARTVLGIPPSALAIIENGLEPDFRTRFLPRDNVRAEWGLKADEIVLVCPVRLVPQKAPDLLLQALAAAPLPDRIRVVFCGRGPMEGRLRRYAAARDLAANLLWLGHVEDLPCRLAAFDACILPSRYEGLSYALLECLAAGLPVVAADIPANLPRTWLREALHLFAPMDPGALRHAIDTVLEDVPARRHAAQKLAPRVLDEFSVPRQAERLARLYRRLGGGGRNDD